MAATGHFSRKATDEISDKCWALMKQGFASGKSSAQIGREVEASTGVRITPRTIGRRAFEWREEVKRIRGRKEEAQAFISAMNEGDLTASEMVKALAMQSIMNDPAAFINQNPLKIQSQNLRAEELMLKRSALALKEREVAVEEGRLRLMQEREQRVLAATRDLEAKAVKGDKITADDIRKIREVYGLSVDT